MQSSAVRTSDVILSGPKWEIVQDFLSGIEGSWNQWSIVALTVCLITCTQDNYGFLEGSETVVNEEVPCIQKSPSIVVF